MTPAQDRRHISALIDEATAAGASLTAACAALGLSSRTQQRWQHPASGIREDRRPDAARPGPRNKLSEAERGIAATKAQAMSHVTEIATSAAADIVAHLTGKPADAQQIAQAIAAAKA